MECGMCTHYWKIEAANGEKSKAICKKCGLEAYFFNYISRYGANVNNAQRSADREVKYCFTKLDDSEAYYDSMVL